MHRCLEITDFQSLHGGSLDPENERRIREHLSSCDRCKASYDQFCQDETIPRSSSPLATDATQAVGPRNAIDTSPIAQANRHLPRIDGYVITGKLGQGGMGVVYRAVQTKLNRPVALKVLPAVIADKYAVERFRREAMSAASLHHTHIVPIYDFGESHDGHYYAMELINGKPLNEVIDTFAKQKVSTASSTKLASILIHESLQLTVPPSLPGSAAVNDPSHSGVISSSSGGRGRPYFRQVATWISHAADALHYAHGQGVIHRDIKPGNMILSNDGRIMVADFGLAKTQEDTSISVVGALIGAIRYVSPEQAMAGRIPLDHRTDIWSLGATLYELLTFAPAFPGTDEKQILSAIISKEPISPRKIDAHVPADLETICLKALEKNPEHRYPTARALCEDLQRWLNDIPIVAKRAGPLRRIQKYAKRYQALSTAVVAAFIILSLTWGFVEARRAWKVDGLLGAATLAEKDGNWERAEAVYREALRLDADNAVVLANLARALQEQYDRKPYKPEMVKEAVDFCAKAREINPKLVNIDNTYGVLLSMAGRFNEAQVIFENNLPGDAPAAHVYSNIAAVHYLSEHYSDAREALQHAIEKPQVQFKLQDGTTTLVPYYHGYHELATLQLLLRDSQAASTIESGIDLQPENRKHFAFYLVKARILLTLPGHLDPVLGHAAAEVAKGLYHAPEPDPYIERYYAISLLRVGRIDSARAAIERSRAAKDLAVFPSLLTALAEAKSGHADLARAALEEADRNWPAELKETGKNIRSRHLGMIWFESADELNDLRREIAVNLPSQP